MDFSSISLLDSISAMFLRRISISFSLLRLSASLDSASDIMASRASIASAAVPEVPEASLSLSSSVSYSVRRWARSATTFSLAEYSLSLFLLSFVSSSSVGTPSGTVAGEGWWTEPHTGHGCPSAREDASIPACDLKNSDSASDTWSAAAFAWLSWTVNELSRVLTEFSASMQATPALLAAFDLSSASASLSLSILATDIPDLASAAPASLSEIPCSSALIPSVSTLDLASAEDTVSSSAFILDNASVSSLALVYLGRDSSMRAFAADSSEALAVNSAALSASFMMFSLTFSSLSSSFAAASPSSSAFLRALLAALRSASASTTGCERPIMSLLILSADISPSRCLRDTFLAFTVSSSSNFDLIPAASALRSTAAL